MTETPTHACPPMWEQDPRIDDGHVHDWQMVVIAPRGAQDPKREAMTVCAECGAPRCSGTFDADPCLGRRHHREAHRHESGRTRAIGSAFHYEELGP